MARFIFGYRENQGKLTENCIKTTIDNRLFDLVSEEISSSKLYISRKQFVDNLFCHLISFS